MKFSFKEGKVKFFFIVAIVALPLIISLDRFDYSFSWHDLLVETHGLFFDLIIFGIILTIYESFRERKDLIKRYNEEIDDYRFWESDEAKYRVRGLIKRLVNLEVTSVDISFCYLRSENFLSQFRNLSNWKFTGANLSESWLLMSNVSNSEFYRTNLSNSVITKVNLSNSQMGSVNLSHANLEEVDFSSVDLTKADMSNAIIIDCIFKGANFRNIALDNAQVSDKDWFDKLKEWNVKGYEELIKTYQIGHGTLYNNRRLYEIELRNMNQS